MRELPLRLQRDGASSLPLSRAEPWRSRVANGRRPDVRAAVGWGRGSVGLQNFKNPGNELGDPGIHTR